MIRKIFFWKEGNRTVKDICISDWTFSVRIFITAVKTKKSFGICIYFIRSIGKSLT